MRYTFWHGPTKTDLEWLRDTVQSLNRNEYTKPLHFDGTRSPDHGDTANCAREHAAIMLLNALRHNTSCHKLTLQNAPLDLKAQLAFSQSMQDNKFLTNLTLKQLTNCNECGDSDGHNDADNTSSSSPPLAIPTGVFENPRLECLTIAQCRLDYAACLSLARMIHTATSSSTTTSFKFHSLSLNQVDIAPQGLPHLFWAIAQSKTLHHLKLENLSWKSATAAQEAEDDAIAATTREFLTTAAAVNTSLVSLQMEHMQLNAALVQEVAGLLKRNAVNLAELSLRHNDLNGDAIQILVQDGLVHNNRLQRLFLSHNPVGDDGAKYLMQGLTPSHGNNSLQELHLVETEIWQDGCLAILQGLRVGCRSLRKVHLDGNNLEACGPKAILAMLQENMVLYSLLERLPCLLRQPKVCKPSSSSSSNGNSSARHDSWRQVDFLLRCNKAKRRFFTQQQYEGVTTVEASSSSSSKVVLSPSLLVPLVLTLQDCGTPGTSASSQPDVLFSFLSACLPQTLMSRTNAAPTCTSSSTATTTTAVYLQEPKVLDCQQSQAQQQQPPPGDVPASPPPTSGMKRRLRSMGSSLPMISRIRRPSTPPSV